MVECDYMASEPDQTFFRIFFVFVVVTVVDTLVVVVVVVDSIVAVVEVAGSIVVIVVVEVEQEY